MNRLVLVSVGLAAVVGASVLGWFEVRQIREFRRLMAVGDAALSHDQTSAAVEAFSGAIALRGDAMAGWLKRGDTYRRRGDYTSALRDLQAAARLDPAALQPVELLADVTAALGDYAGAAHLYAKYVAADDRAPRVLYKLALAHFRHSELDRARASVQKALALDPQFVEAHYLLALCERDGGHLDRALASLSKAISLNPTFAAAREELATLHFALGRRGEALDQLEALAALDTRGPDRLIRVARAYARSGRIDPAFLTLGRAAERFSTAPEVHLATAQLWLDTADNERDRAAAAKAAESLRRAERGRRSPEYFLLRGRAQLLGGDAAGAERSLLRATANLPVDPAAFRYLADAADRLGHRETAASARARYEALTR